jgi:hypothetical protein
MSDHPESRNGFVNPSVKYEHSDLSFRAVMMFSFALVAVLAAVSGGLWFMIPLFIGPVASQKPLVSNEGGPWQNWEAATPTSPAVGDSRLTAPPELEAIDQTAPASERGRHTRPIQVQIKEEEDYLNLSPGEDIASLVGALASPANGPLLGLSRFSARGVGHVPIEAAMKALAGGER